MGTIRASVEKGAPVKDLDPERIEIQEQTMSRQISAERFNKKQSTISVANIVNAIKNLKTGHQQSEGTPEQKRQMNDSFDNNTSFHPSLSDDDEESPEEEEDDLVTLDEFLKYTKQTDKKIEAIK